MCVRPSALVQKSASSKPGHDKFRLVFALPRPVEGWQNIRICNSYLAHVMGVGDPACKDASRFFFGARGSTPDLIQAVTLPASFVDHALAWEAENERLAQIEQAKRAAYLATLDASDQAQLAKDALGFIPPYTPGGGTYNDLIVMMAGVVNDLGAEGEVLLEAWGGFGRETAKKVAGLSRTPNKKATLGTLFHLAKDHGFKFPKREFTPEQKRAYAKLKSEEHKMAGDAAGSQSTDTNLVQFPSVDRPEAVERCEVDAAIELSQATADIAGLLPSLYLVLAAKAQRFNSPIEALAGMLLPIGGSLLSSKIQLKIEEGYYVPPIIWAGLVGGSGAIKTPNLQAVAKPVQSLQSEAYQRYDSERKFYEKELKEWSKKREGDEPEEPEKLRHYYTSDFTIELVIKIVAEQPDNGLGVIVDELAGFVNSFGEYKSGGGSDRQKWLSSYNGLPVKSDRKSSGTLMADRANINVAGTIQPSVLRKLMGDTDEVDGLWPRFLWFGVPTTVMPAPGEMPAIDVTEILKNIYIRMSSYTGDTCVFSAQAQRLWVTWHHFTEELKMKATSQSVQAIYPKAREQAARVALIAHHLEAAAQGIAPMAEISVDTLSAAISLVKYCINQSLLVYGALGATDDNPEAICIAKFIERYAGQAVAWKQVRPILPKTRVGKNRRAANKPDCLAFLQRVVELGFGVDHGDDCSSIVVNEPPVETEINYEYTESEVA